MTTPDRSPQPSRRTLLRVAGAAASALALPVAAGAGPAWAGRRPPVGGPQTVTIGTRAGLFSGLPGPIPNGIRLTLGLTGTNGGGVVYPDKLALPNLGELTTFNPTALPIGDARTATVTLDIGPVQKGDLPTQFGLQLSYLYVVDGDQFMKEVRQTVTLVPLAALGRTFGSLPPGSLALGPHATPAPAGGLTFSVTAVGPPTGAAFGLSYMTFQGHPTVSTFDPNVLSPSGVQAFAVTAPVSLTGSFTAQLAGQYDVGHGLVPVASQPARITVVPPQVFRLRPPLPG